MSYVVHGFYTQPLMTSKPRKRSPRSAGLAASRRGFAPPPAVLLARRARSTASGGSRAPG